MARPLINSTVVDGAAQARTEPLLNMGQGGSVLVVAGAALQLMGSSISGSSAVSGGGIYVSGAGSKAVLGAGSEVRGCTAMDDGGGIAVDDGASVVITGNAVVGDNEGEAGSGGGIGAGYATFVELQPGAKVANNVAAGLGGGVACIECQLIATRAIVSGNSAKYGGGVAWCERGVVTGLMRATASADVPMASSGAVVGPHSLVSVTSLVDGADLSGNAATNAGAAAVLCGAPVAVRGSGTSFGSTGDDVFVCAASNPSFVPGRARPDDLPWLRTDAASFSAVAPSSIHGPLAELEFVTPMPSALMSGSAVQARIRGCDWLGQVLVDPRQEIVLSIDDAGGTAKVSGREIEVLAEASVVVPQRAVAVSAAATLPLALEWRISAATAATVSGSLPVAPLVGMLNVTACRVGFGGATGDDGFVTCVACGDGLISLDLGLGSCVAAPTCQVGAQRSGGSLASNTSSVSGCVCSPGFWAPDGNADTGCEVCPRGGVCAGGDARPVAGPGFFPDDSDPALFVSCPCRRFSSRLNAVVTVILVLGCAVAAGLILAFNLAESVRYKFAAAMIGLNALQISAMYGKLDLDWGPVARVYFNVAAAVNIDFELTSPECAAAAGTDVWVLKWVLTLLLPVFAGALLCVIGGAVVLLSSRSRGEVISGVGRAWFQILVLLYLPLVNAAFAPFGCQRDESGRMLLGADPSRRCFNFAWWVGLFVPGLVAVIIYGAGIPGAVVGVLRWKRATLHEAVVMARYGFLVGRFVDEAWWFECAILARKVLVVMCMTFFSHDATKASVAVMVLVCSLLQLAMGRPAMNREEKAAETEEYFVEGGFATARHSDGDAGAGALGMSLDTAVELHRLGSEDLLVESSRATVETIGVDVESSMDSAAVLDSVAM
ncbi:uncharacterized protein AMSG_10216 [Thecamonas trahens ATCC 50062]|uniref:Right handed beta helix domain-containing protein n=1 Tax=Thecamonas trahens ATCC 50062 TaxID=461836 RepID=A0A0L0DSG1_THETB|nr:hypothetical protein AMSG_10216 [Thecamonas trahens ATCC 50062]KNC54971.1 hypothetical protein AMSG_10216 [Thecamonas trahens ATCC 50062]|eukprot:XP_013753418.1 hypothetical protein AMSG_10216 [Thecamonas trahens ATCC 50062]